MDAIHPNPERVQAAAITRPAPSLSLPYRTNCHPIPLRALLSDTSIYESNGASQTR
jgi:hypothetical protein